MPNPIKTYVLVGHDNDELAEQYEKRGDCTVIRYKPGLSLKDALTQIEPPANLITICHAKEGQFLWSEDTTKLESYEDLFKGLPASGMFSTTLMNCKGGSAQAALHFAPSGMLVQTFSSDHGSTMIDLGIKFINETKYITSPINLYLKALDNFDSAYYKQEVEDVNRFEHGRHPPRNSDPEHALPRILGLGGNPAQSIDLNTELHSLKDKAADPAYQRAILRVQAHFDTDRPHKDCGDKIQHTDSDHGSLGSVEEAKLDKRIAALAAKLAVGYEPKGAEEKRIAYGIMAAYLAESGELERRIDKIPGAVPFTKLDAVGNSIPVNAKTSVHNGKVTGMEQTYIDSVEKKLTADPLMWDKVFIITQQLKAAFSQTDGNDRIDDNLKQTLNKAHISTKSWER